MTAEQGDVEVIRAAISCAHPISADDHDAVEDADAALDRLVAAKKACERQYQEKVNQLLQVTVALERAEQERDEAYRKDKSRRHLAARAEKAERALAENEQAWEDMRAYNIRLEERAREAERALGEIAQLGQPMSGLETAWTCAEIARAALRPSEDTSDES